MRLHNIMVPLDGRAPAERAALTAAAIARANGPELHLVLVHEGAVDPHVNAQGRTNEQTYHDQRVRNLAADVRVQFGITVVTALRAGPVPRPLVSYVFGNAIDLIVMTSHGHTGWRRAWAGSVADELAHRVSVPLLMLRLDDDRAVL